MNLSGSTLTGTFTMAGKTGNATVEFTAAGITQVGTVKSSAMTIVALLETYGRRLIIKS